MPKVDLPKFPICGQGREGCKRIGHHAGCGPVDDESRRRVRAWNDAVAAAWTSAVSADELDEMIEAEYELRMTAMPEAVK